MEVNEVKQKKKQLEEIIVKLIRDFQIETDIDVVSITTNHLPATSGEKLITSVKIITEI